MKRFRFLSVLTLLALLASCTQIPAPEFAPDPPLEPQALPNVWINELHYDNDGADTSEAIEVAGEAGTDLTGWNVVLYNGSSSQLKPYDTIALAGPIPDQSNGFGTLEFAGPSIQNGAPDGLALMTANSEVVQFISYEGSFTAVEGPASGMTSTDIGVSESSSTAVGTSLQLTGVGSKYADFSWSESQTSTFGSVNTGQSFGEAGEAPPSVSSTVPAADATGVALDSDLVITFSEPVNVTGTWFVISCNLSGTVGTVSAAQGSPWGPTVFTLDPDADFAEGESCTVTVTASQVTDQDSDDPPDAMAADYSFSFSTQLGLVKIHAVQGSTDSSPLDGQLVTVKGVVVGNYQNPEKELSGFFLQEEVADTDDNPTTSEGIFVYSSSAEVAEGDRVSVTGTVDEFFGLTEITDVTDVTKLASGAGSEVAATTVSLPVPERQSIDAFWEPLEGMLIEVAEPMTVIEYFQLGRFGQVVLSASGRQYQYTSLHEPSQEGYAAQQKDLARSRLLLGDYSNLENRTDFIRFPYPKLSPDNFFRGGDTVTVRGVLSYGFGDYRLYPQTSEPLEFESENPRSEAPEEVGGNLTVASFNVLNYFATIDDGTVEPEPRGANSQAELERQRAKIISALVAINADVVGLIEIENRPQPTKAIESLVTELNAELGAGTYDYIASGTQGTDVIRTALIYKPASVTPLGDFAVLDNSDDPRFNADKNRPVLAQSFTQDATGAVFTVAVNHLKSKGSDCDDLGDPNAGDGQGNCSGIRTQAAKALVDWLASDPTASGDPDFLIIGDLNSYALEDPISAIKVGPDDQAGTADDYTNLINEFVGLDAYSYVFDGQLGYLDHALANASLEPQVTGATIWHINADEVGLFDYQDTVDDPGEPAFESQKPAMLYRPHAYRSSDHDPVLVGLELTYTPAEVLDALQFFVDQYQADGTLNRGQANAFSKKLEHVEHKLERGQTKPALNQLHAFENQVQAFARSGKLSQEQSGQLLTLTRSLRDSL